MATLSIRIDGSTPLMMHNSRLANPLDPIAKRLKELTSKRKKVDDDYEQISRVEFEGGIYWDEEVGVFLPAQCLEATIINAAKITRNGRDVKSNLRVIEDKIALDYEGPRKIEALYRNRAFVDMRMVNVQNRKTLRTRPIFNPPWSAQFTIAYNEAFLNERQIKQFMEAGGQQVGLCDYRPRYGLFTAKLIDSKN